MPNIIPPIVSSSPPPLDPIDDDNDEDENDDDFGDFTGADFGSHTDSTLPKSIPDTSWTLPSLMEPLPPKPDIFPNGAIMLELSSEEALPPSHTEVLDDDELLENADNASHDSVVSAVSDSGNCSASQNSNGTSPMPIAEVEDEAVIKSDACHLDQNSSTSQTTNGSTVSGDINCSAPATNQTISDSNEASDLGDSRTLNISNETLIDDSSQLSADVLISSPAKKCSDSLSCTESGVYQEENFESEVVTANVSAEKPISYTTSIPSVGATNNDNGDPDGFGVWNSTVPELNGFEPLGTQSDLVTPELKSESSTIETEAAKGFDGFEDDDCVRGMIIPDIPGLGDFNGDDDDDDFGEFSGIESSAQYPSGAQSIDDPSCDAQYQSPSRRPTLVLSENVTDLPDEPVSSIEEVKAVSQLLSDEFPEESNSNSLEENTPALSNAVKEENCVVTSQSNKSASQSPTFEGDFADEFADFSQAGGEGNPASDVWAQAAQASTIQNALPSQDPLEFDDFDDYESAEFQSADPKPNLDRTPSAYFDLNKIQSTLSEVLKENFPLPNESNVLTEMENMGTSGLSGLILDVEESRIWQGLRDLEATPSLSFQWPGSHSNRGLLGALNIDSRNILFGPKWNTVVPRFAANLGFSPLEPVRAVQNQPPSEPPPRPEVIQPQVVENVKPSSSEQGVVPAAQFDWNDSGLTNPLDSNKEQMNGALATTAASGNPAMTSTPLQVEQLLASSKRSAPLSSLEQKSRDPTLSPEAVRVLDTLPELAFLSARMLMFPVQGDRNENKL